MTPISPGSRPSTDEFRIYKYHDGMKEIFADPMTLQRELAKALEGRPDELSQQAGSQDNAIAFPALEKILAATVRVFGLVPFDRNTGAGLVETEVLQRWNDFQDWLAKKKAKVGSTPTSAIISGPAPSPFPTQSVMGSGLISPASGSRGQQIQDEAKVSSSPVGR